MCDKASFRPARSEKELSKAAKELEERRKREAMERDIDYVF